MIGDILQPTHLLFVLVIALLVLGPKRLPEVGRALGRGLRDFRHALSDADPRDELLADPTPEITPQPVQTAATLQPVQTAATPHPAEPAATASEPAEHHT